jgi:Ca2+/H+ antiporter, TMEM165/GDT1 family
MGRDVDPHALRLAASVFGVIFVAELPDKTALAALVLATKHRPLPVFLGAAAALTVQSVVAVAAGRLVGLLPARTVHLVAGAVFFVSAVVMWTRRADEADEAEEGDAEARAGGGEGAPARRGPGKRSFWRALATVFGVVFVAEWGDLTQFATAAFAAHEASLWVVFASATLALWAVTAIAVGIGHRAAKMLDPKVTQRVASGVFAAVGVALLAGWL